MKKSFPVTQPAEHLLRRCLRFSLALWLLVLTSGLVHAQTFPAGFSASLVASGIRNPTALAFAPDGRIFVGEQTGALRVIKNGSLLPTPFVTLTVNSSGERGLVGVTLDPNFASNNYIYLYYTLPTGANNRIIRLRASGDVAAAGSEVTILNLDPLTTATNHNGGAMNFGKDGKLYVAVGDNANGANAQNLDTNLGKLLRINPDGSIPSGNPYTGPGLSVQRQQVWSYGLRNPYTFGVQPGTGRIFVNDVGGGSWEEVNDATTSALNYGWPNNEGANVRPGQTPPFYAYPHGISNPDGRICAITGGAFFNPPSTNYPATYRGKYFFQDFCGRWIHYIDPSSSTPVRTVFATNLSGDLVGLDTGPDGNLYYLSRSAASLYKIVYTAGTTAPVITTQPTSATVSQGVSATFSVAVNGTAPFSYQWQKDGANIPGATASSYTIASVAAADAGQYRVVVTNSVGSVTSNAATLTVTAVNNPPTAQILTPASGATYVAGTEVQFSADATDPEDGALPASAFVWQVNFHHDDHVHDGTPFNQGSKTGIFAIPDAGETADNVFYRLILTVTDAGGRKTTIVRDILPQKSTISLATSPAGLGLTLDGAPQSTPASIVGVEGVVRSLGAPSPQTVNGVTYEFVSWSNGGAQTQTIATPTADVTYTATYRVRSETGPAVTSFTLYNADTDQPIAGYNPLLTGATLNLAELPTRNLNIQANTNPSRVGSVRFGYDTNANFRLENLPPYALAGDNGTTSTGAPNFSPWTPTLGSHTLTATAFTQGGAGGTAGTPLSVTFTVVNNAPSTLRAPENPANTTSGLDYAYYEGTGWGMLPDFATLTPVRTGTSADFSLVPRMRNEDFAFRYSGYLTVPTDGIYTLYTSSDDGSKLFIGSTLVVDNDGLHGAQERNGQIGLKAGKHAITVTFFERGGGEVLNVSYAGPGISKTAVPAGALSRVAPSSAQAATQRVSADLPPVVELYPNPARDEATISLQVVGTKEARVEVYDVMGQRVAKLTQLTHAGRNDLRLPLRRLPNGVYSVVITYGTTRSIQRLLIAR